MPSNVQRAQEFQAALWDRIVESAMVGSTGTPSVNGFRRPRISLRASPLQWLHPHHPRILGRVPERVLRVWRSLLDGELPFPLTLTGPAGTGKTSAALAIADWCDGQAAYFTTRTLGDAIDCARDNRYAWYSADQDAKKCDSFQFWKAVARVSLVIMDEVGLRKPSDAAYENLKTLLDQRPDPRAPTILLSNLSLGELAQVYDDRILSRLSAGTVQALDGPDRRQEEREVLADVSSPPTTGTVGGNDQ